MLVPFVFNRLQAHGCCTADLREDKEIFGYGTKVISTNTNENILVQINGAVCAFGWINARIMMKRRESKRNRWIDAIRRRA